MLGQEETMRGKGPWVGMGAEGGIGAGVVAGVGVGVVAGAATRLMVFRRRRSEDSSVVVAAGTKTAPKSSAPGG